MKTPKTHFQNWLNFHRIETGTKKKTFPTTHKKYPSHILLLTWAGSVWVQPKSETRRVSRSSATPIINHKKHSSVKRRTESGKARVHAKQTRTSRRCEFPCHFYVMSKRSSCVSPTRPLFTAVRWRANVIEGWITAKRDDNYTFLLSRAMLWALSAVNKPAFASYHSSRRGRMSKKMKAPPILAFSFLSLKMQIDLTAGDDTLATLSLVPSVTIARFVAVCCYAFTVARSHDKRQQRKKKAAAKRAYMRIIKLSIKRTALTQFSSSWAEA